MRLSPVSGCFALCFVCACSADTVLVGTDPSPAQQGQGGVQNMDPTEGDVMGDTNDGIEQDDGIVDGQPDGTDPGVPDEGNPAAEDPEVEPSPDEMPADTDMPDEEPTDGNVDPGDGDPEAPSEEVDGGVDEPSPELPAEGEAAGGTDGT